MISRSLVFGAALLAAPVPVFAQDWQVDPSHASILFQVEHLGFSNVQGTFRDFDIEVGFDPDDLEATTATVTIDAASVDTLWEARDEHIRNEDFLDVESYPEITFTSTGVEMTGENTADITGDLTLHGETAPVTFAATLNKLDVSPLDDSKRIAGFTMTGEIDRTEFGVDLMAPAIAAIIPVTINVELIGPAE